MTYDQGLAQRVRERLGGLDGVTEMRMFGGIGFLLHGNMVLAVSGDELTARVGPQGTERALTRREARPTDFTGRPMRGWVTIGGPSLVEDPVLDHWVTTATVFAASLPPK
ncbi:TfoX/Sxy family protein [Streptomyces erythrochromogenes]|uniref:TfoX/Sxy family protein n=1 Tax=Streptomyces erythrochromogenes TaxID=285574 RepID=UPI00386556AA|nr:TfoX/Sxy family protein [Streptomyces erythrochromogenes]